jgi:hypothetical protein
VGCIGHVLCQGGDKGGLRVTLPMAACMNSSRAFELTLHLEHPFEHAALHLRVFISLPAFPVKTTTAHNAHTRTHTGKTNLNVNRG